MYKKHCQLTLAQHLNWLKLAKEISYFSRLLTSLVKPVNWKLGRLKPPSHWPEGQKSGKTNWPFGEEDEHGRCSFEMWTSCVSVLQETSGHSQASNFCIPARGEGPFVWGQEWLFLPLKHFPTCKSLRGKETALAGVCWLETWQRCSLPETWRNSFWPKTSMWWFSLRKPCGFNSLY